MERGHDKLSVYGVGKDQSKSYWNKIIRQLLNGKYIAIKNWEYRNLCLTQKSSEILKKKIVFKLRKHKETTPIKQKIENTIAMSHERPELFEQLRVIRKALAIEKKCSPLCYIWR